MSYIETMRKKIGNELLMTVGCGIIIENEGRILLQHRKDKDVWGIPGGVMEPGETFMETAIRETIEETGLNAHNLQLFGLYSGAEGFASYENGDEVYSVQVIFHTQTFTGQLLQETDESHEHRFFARDALPKLNTHQERFIRDWVNRSIVPIVK